MHRNAAEADYEYTDQDQDDDENYRPDGRPMMYYDENYDQDPNQEMNYE